MKVIVFFEDILNPAAAAKDVPPTFGKDRDELKEAVRNTWDERYFNVIFFIELILLFPEAEFLFLEEIVLFCLPYTASKDDGIIDQWVSLTSQKVRLRKLSKHCFRG